MAYEKERRQAIGPSVPENRAPGTLSGKRSFGLYQQRVNRFRDGFLADRALVLQTSIHSAVPDLCQTSHLSRLPSGRDQSKCKRWIKVVINPTSATARSRKYLATGNRPSRHLSCQGSIILIGH